MSTRENVNRRELLGKLGFSFLGAAVLGTTMARCMRTEWLSTMTAIIEADPHGLPKSATSEGIQESLEDYYDEQLKPNVKRLTTALGAVIGYVSHDQAIKPQREPDIY